MYTWGRVIHGGAEKVAYELDLLGKVLKLSLF